MLNALLSSLSRCRPAQILMLAVLCGNAWASDYVPDTVEFPAAPPIAFPSNPVLNLAEGGTIEFWVAADWRTNPGYHPVLLSNESPSAPVYRVSIRADRQALLFQSGNKHAEFAFNFADGHTHHVAILSYAGELVAMIDGKFKGVVDLPIKTARATEFFIGSQAGGRSPFEGSVSALRIWEVPLTPEDIAAYAIRDVNDAEQKHPEIDMLVAISDFGAQSVSVVETEIIDIGPVE